MAEDIEVSNLVTKLSIDDTGVEQSMAQLARQMQVVQSEFKAASSKLGEHVSSQEALKTKADSLNKQLDLQGQRVAKLASQHEESAKAKGADARETQSLEVKLNKAVAQYNKLHHELSTTNAEMAKQQAEVTKTTSKWEQLSTSLDNASKKMKDHGDKMMAAGQGLALMVTAPLAAVGTASAKASIDFESAFAGVRKTVDATEAEFKQIEQSIRDMAKDIPASATAIASVAEAAGQLGIKNEALMGFTRTMSDLGVATNMSAEQAATSLARLANITQMPQENFDRLGATIVALGNNLATTESEITEMALRLAGAGNQIGMTEAQILAFAGSLSSVGIEAEAGGSAFSRVMINMAQAVATGGKDLNNFAAVAGMSVSQFKESFQKDAAGALVTFVEGLGKMSAEGQNTFAVLDALGLSEIRVRDALLRASNAGDLFRNSMELGTKAWEENSALTDEAGRRYETTASQLKILGNRIIDAAIRLGDALVPAIMATLDALEPMFRSIEKGAEWFANLDPETQKTILSMLAMAAAAGPLLILSGKLVTSIASLIPVVKGLGTALVWLTTNPVGMAITVLGVLATAIYSVSNGMEENRKAALELKQAQEELQAVQQNGIERHEIEMYEEKKVKVEELIETYQKLIDKALEVSDTQKVDKSLADSSNSIIALSTAAKELDVSIVELQDIAHDFGITLEFMDENSKISARSMEQLAEAQKTYVKAIKDAKRETTSELNDMAKQIAVRKQEVAGIENLLKTYNSAEKSSDEWKAAQKALINQFPQFATATGINTKAIEGLVLMKRQEIAEEWKSIQVKAIEAVQEKNSAIAKQESAIKIAEGIIKIAGTSGMAETALRKMNEELERMRGEAASLQALIDMKPEDIKIDPVTVTPVYIPSGKGNKSSSTKTKAYSNDALDAAYKQLEHKKRLDQLTLESELETLLEIKKAHIKTADERMAIEEKLHDVKKQILERDKYLQKNNIEAASQKLQAAFEDRMAREVLNSEEEYKLKDRLLNDQIWLQKNYLEKVKVDSKYTAAEKKEIEKEVTESIRQHTNDRLNLQRDYNAEVIRLAKEQAKEQNKAQIDSINDMSKAVQDALKAKYQAEKKAAEDSIKAEQQANDEWKKTQLDSVKAVYNARVDAAQKAADAEIARINTVYNAQIEAIQKQLDAMNKAEKQRSREELDADDQKRIDRLRSKIDYERDDYNRKQLQDELNKVIAEMNERHRQEELEDKKESLKEEQKAIKNKLDEETQAIRDQLAIKKEILAEEYEAQQANINAMYLAKKTSLEQELEDLQEHYDKLLEMKQLQAEAEKLIIEKQHEEILLLLEEFNDGYLAAGQTLGEKLLEGFKPQVDEISSMIAKVISQIDSARSAALELMAEQASASSASSSASEGRGIMAPTAVSVTNNFNSPVTSPSAISAATRKTAQELAMKM